ICVLRFAYMRLSLSTVMVSPLMMATGRLESSAIAAAVDCGAGAACWANAAEVSSSSGMSVRLIKSNPPDGVSDDALTNRVTGGEHSGHAERAGRRRVYSA